MTFKEAKEKVKEIAKGKYHVIEYSLTEYHNGVQVAGCKVYVDGKDWYHAGTWEGAIKQLTGESLSRDEEQPE